MALTDYPLKPCDFRKWTRYESLPIEQACFVLLGYEPPSIQVLRYRPVQYQERPGATWEKPPGFDDMLAQLDNSIKAGKVAFRQDVEHNYMTKHVGWAELVNWAESKGYEVPLDLTAVQVVTTSANGTEEASTAPETVEQRRARYLQWHAEEERVNKRGALQRVFERERLQNPKADRANIGKDIAKERMVRAEQSRVGAWGSQLVRDGKRKG